MQPKANARAKYPFTSMIVCGSCGAHYRRKTTIGKVAWQCDTFIRHGKSVCHAKQIPENILYQSTAEVLGLSVFDEAVFFDEISELRVPTFNHVIFVFRDDHQVERVWKDRSRSESWTDEMKQRTAEKARRQHR